MALDFPSNPIDGQVLGNYVWSASSGAWKSKPTLGSVTIQSSTAPQSANSGDIWVNTSDGTAFTYFDDGTSRQWMEILSSGVPNISMVMPTGSIIQTALPTVPAGWLFCDGSAVSRTTYASLFLSLGVTYGSGDGVTTFNIPNLQGRIPVGKNASTFSTLGATGGVESVTLTAAQSGIPAHSHPNTLSDPTHTHGPASGYIAMLQNTYPTANSHNIPGGGGYISPNVGSVGYSSTGITINNANNLAANASQAHTNLQPYIVLNYMIKV